MKKQCTLFIFFSLFILVSAAHGQELERIYNETAAIGENGWLQTTTRGFHEEYERAWQEEDPAAIAESAAILGCYLVSGGQLDHGLPYLEQAVVFYQETGQIAEAADLSITTGRTCLESGNHEKAIPYFDFALEFLELSENLYGKAICSTYAAKARRVAGSQYEALILYRTALPILEEFGDLARAAVTMNAIGEIHYRSGNTSGALDFFEKALTLHRESSGIPPSAALHLNLGILYRDLGRTSDTLEHLEQSLAILRTEDNQKTLDNWIGKAYVLNNLGGIYQVRLQYPRALEYFAESLEYSQNAWRNSRSPELEYLSAQNYWNMGTIQEVQGDYENALGSFQDSQEIYDRLGFAAESSKVGVRIGVLFHHFGLYEQALDYLDRAIEVFDESGLGTELAGALSEKAVLLIWRGDYRQAQSLLTESENLYLEADSPLGLAATYQAMSSLYAAWGDFDAARSYCRLGHKISETEKDKQGIFTALYNLARISCDAEMYEEALELFSRLPMLAEELNSGPKTAASYAGMAEAYEALGQYELADQCYRKFLTFMSGMNSIIEYYQDYGMFLAKQERFTEALTYLESSLYMSEEKGQQRSTANALYRRAGIYFRLGDLEKCITDLERTVSIYETLRITAPGAIRREFLEQYIDAYCLLSFSYMQNEDPKRAFETTEKYSARYFLEQMGVEREELLTIIENQLVEIAKLPDDTVAVDFFNVGWSGMIGRITLRNWDLVSYGFELDDFIDDVSAYCGDRISMELALLDLTDESKDTAGLSFNEIVRYYKSLLESPYLDDEGRDIREFLGHALFDFLFQGLEQELDGKKEILILPDGILSTLPFECLRLPDGSYLAEKYNVRYAPSFSVYHILGARKAEDESGGPLLAFGGAVYDEKKYPRSVARSEEQLEALVKMALNDMERGASMSEAYASLGLGNWSNLPGTRTEVLAIEKIVDNAVVFTGDEASENAVKEMSSEGSLDEFKVIHFATHGLSVPETPELSALVLSQSPGEEDGYLRMGEIADLDINADFVNLSACETGLGKVYAGEGVVGLTQSFLIAGANGLSVSLWQVADNSTMVFMVGLYQLVEEEGLDYFGAMMEMKRRFIHSDQYTEPYYWAPFIFYGR